MATTAGEILARAQALGYGTDIKVEQLSALNQIHRRIINTRRWRFLLTTEQLVEATVGDGTYALSTKDVVDAVRLELGTERLTLEYQSISLVRDFEHMYRDSGVPEYWTIVGSELHIWPLPDKKYKIMLDFVTKPVALATEATNIQVPDSHADILVWGVIMAATFRERDWEGHNFARQMYAEYLAEMLAQWGQQQRQTSAQVVDSGFYDEYDIEDPWLT